MQREMAAHADRIIEVDCDHMVPFVFPGEIAAPDRRSYGVSRSTRLAPAVHGTVITG